MDRCNLEYAYEMRISNQASSTSKETTFKAEESNSDLTYSLEALLVRKMRKKYKGKPKCFNCGQLGHFAKCRTRRQ